MLKKDKKTLVIKQIGIILTFVAIAFGFFSNRPVPTLALSTYEQQKNAIASKKKIVAEGLASVSSDLEDVTQLSNTLKEEIAKKQRDIATTDNLIIVTDQLIKDLDLQIIQNQKDLKELVDQMKGLLIELQKQSQVSPLESVVTSKNLSEALSSVYNISALQSKAENLRLKIETTTAELEQNKTDEVETREKLESSKFLLSSQKSTLEDLRNKTQNDEAKYQQLRKNLLAENSLLEAQNKQVEAARQAEINEAKRRQQEQQSQQSSVRSSSGNTGGGNGNTGISCWFEDPRALNVPNGFFGKPANGRLERVFDSCQHDGADISNSTNTPLWAVADGVVVKKGSGDVAGYGNYVVIKSQLPSGQQVYALYAHMYSASPRNETEVVRKGQVVGYMGCTGTCYGTHVHFMLYSDTYAENGPGCRLGSSKCYNPAKYIPL